MNLSGREGPGDGRLAAVERPEVPLPPRFEVVREGSSLRIRWRWFTPVALFFLFFTLFWNGFLWFWYTEAVPGSPLIFTLFPLIHVAVGVGLAYFTLALFLNRTTVTASRGTLEVRHRPLPWMGNRALGGRDVKQLFCTEKVSRSDRGPRVTYEVQALLAGDRKVTLLKGLEMDQALFVEQRLERHLGIEDRPVGGELPR